MWFSGKMEPNLGSSCLVVVTGDTSDTETGPDASSNTIRLRGCAGATTRSCESAKAVPIDGYEPVGSSACGEKIRTE